MRIVILAAGVGSRLGNPEPKPLTRLRNGESILGRALRLLGDGFDPSRLCVVVGYKKDLIMEAFPEVLYVYNREYGDTNTSKSLLRAMHLTKDEPVLWVNGDVVFDEAIVPVLRDAVQKEMSFVCVNTEDVGDEEIKYTLDASGNIAEISKTVEEALGEAVGINFVSAADKALLVDALEVVDDGDYFERGLELAIAKQAMKVSPLDITAYPCIEVDFREDLERARAEF